MVRVWNPGRSCAGEIEIEMVDDRDDRLDERDERDPLLEFLLGWATSNENDGSRDTAEREESDETGPVQSSLPVREEE